MSKITDINNLNKGDEVLFRDRAEPCTVTEEASAPSGPLRYRHVVLEGPRGARIVINQEGDQKPNSTGGGPIDNLRVVS